MVMGILNLTPDSFYVGSRIDAKHVVSTAEQMIKDGADILDMGGYSSRPGAQDISVESEISRVVPAIQQVRRMNSDILISVDTFRPKVAEAALKAGANIVNDISGGNEAMYRIVSQNKAAYVMMHMRGTPQTMQTMTAYGHLFDEILKYFEDRIELATALGVEDITIDPGFGFSKTIEQNYELMAGIDRFQKLNKKILVGISRKSMIYKLLEILPENSLEGTSALNLYALLSGAAMIRVHDVNEAVQMRKLASALSPH